MATLGKPAIGTPSQLDLRAVANAISNARQRIEAIEALLTATNQMANTTVNSTGAQIAALQQQVAVLQIANSETEIPDENVIVDHLPSATYRTQEDFNNVMLSPGIITGGTITDAGGGSISVAGGTAILRIADDNVSSLVFVDFPTTVIAIPATGTLRFVGLSYNSGNPVVSIRTSESWDNDTEIAMGSAGNVSGNVFVFNNPFLMGDPITNIIQRFDSFAHANRDAGVGGLAIGETGTRNFTMTAGKVWARLNDFAAAAIDTSVSGSILSAYYNGTAWVFALGVTQWPNTQYNDITTGLVTMGSNKFANLWFYLTIETGTVVFQYGQAEYNTSAAAAAEPPPSFRPPGATDVSLLLGRFIFQKSAATTSEIDQAFDSVFAPAVVTNHNNLSGLQGGTTAEYYHLTSAQYASLATSANPTASVGLAAVNGVASTFMRSDAAPPLSQAITPTWTGMHTFAPAAGGTLFQSAALATSATDGFPYFATCAGKPTGAATAHTGVAAGVYDTTNDAFYVYNGAWKVVSSTIPQNSQTANYTTVLADAGKHILHPSSDANARTFTIDSNANVAYPIGTALTFVNRTSQVVTIAITSDSLILAGSVSTGSRSLGQNGVATAIKTDATVWLISGPGLS